MASSNSTPYYQSGGYPFADLPDTFTSVPQQSTPYYNIAFPEQSSVFDLDQEREQYGISDASMNTTSGLLGPGYNYPRDFAPQPQGPAEPFKRHNDTKQIHQPADGMNVTGTFHGRSMSQDLPGKVETTPNRPSFLVQNMQGINIVQPVINHFGEATQNPPVTNFSQSNNFHNNTFISNSNNGYGNHITDATTRNSAAQQHPPLLPPPPYSLPPPGHLPTFDDLLELNGPVQKHTSVPGTPILKEAEEAVSHRTRGTKRKGEQTAQATPRKRSRTQLSAMPTQLPAVSTQLPVVSTQLPAVSNAAQTLAAIATQAPSFTNLPHQVGAPPPLMFAFGVVPEPAERITVNSSVNTRARNPNQVYGTQMADRPPHKVLPPSNIDISMLEICTFFPNWFLLPEVAMRAQANGWDRKEVAKAQFNATGVLYTLTDKEFRRGYNRVQKQISGGGKAMFHIPPGRQYKWSKEYVKTSNFPKDNLSAVNWRFKSDHLQRKKQDQWGHYKLEDIYRHVPLNNWPTGADRMILTRCLEFAHNNQRLDLDTSHIDWICYTQNFVQGPRQTSQHDKDALARFQARVADR